MKRENLNTWIALVALTMSVISMTMMYVRTTPFEFDYLALLMAFAGLLVSLYVGAQVYHSFTLSRTLDQKSESLLERVRKENDQREERLKEEIDKKVKEQIADYDHTVTAMTNQLYAICECYRNNRFEVALEYLFSALEEINLATDKTPLDGILSYIEPTVDGAKGVYTFNEETINRYIKELAVCGTKEATRLIPIIYSLLRA